MKRKKLHDRAGETFPAGELWTPAGQWPNGKTLAHLMACPDCREGFERASKESNKS